jgi:hypothetical protein
MTVQQSDVTFLQSSLTGSTGGGISGVTIVSGVDNNLWPDISPAEATAGGTRSLKWFMRNDHPSDTLEAFGTWVEQAPVDCTEELGVGFDASEDDDPAQGDLVATGADAVVELVSSAADTRQATVIGENVLGQPVEEVVTLTGTTPVQTAVTFAAGRVYAVRLSATGAQTVTIKEGAGGTTRGDIPASKLCTWQWLSPAAFASALKRTAIGPGDIVGVWDRLTWVAGASEVDPTQSIIGVQRLA